MVEYDFFFEIRLMQDVGQLLDGIVNVLHVVLIVPLRAKEETTAGGQQALCDLRISNSLAIFHRCNHFSVLNRHAVLDLGIP